MLERYRRTRELTETICSPLHTEDYIIQAMEDVSPPRWHLAHTTWFFETVILQSFSNYRPLHPEYNFLFNSYYVGLGERWIRAERGRLSRPTISEIYDYRKRIDDRMIEFLQQLDSHPDRERAATLIQLGIEHEKQHQELLLIDIKYNFFYNPLRPVFSEDFPFPGFPQTVAGPARNEKSSDLRFYPIAEGLYTIGTSILPDGKSENFSFDNERPEHKVYLNAFQAGTRLITNREFLEFINDGGYRNHRLWLADGFDWAANFNGPLYWTFTDNEILEYSLQNGDMPVNLDAPVTHINFFEADAFCRWAGYILPEEAQWEVFARTAETDLIRQEAWQWTASAYRPYPGFQTEQGSVEEYNGKFMNGQYVLRGGSSLTPENHVRLTYRNFFQPDKRWPQTSIRPFLRA